MTRKTPEQCLERAAACECQAAATTDKDNLHLLQDLAAQWRALAKSTVAAPLNPETTP